MCDIDVIVFCYRGEEEILPMTLGRLHAELPEARIHLADDANDPLLSKTIDLLKQVSNCTYRKTYFNRNNNLNGKECVIGELELMHEIMEETVNKDGYIIKMDPDTLLLRADLIVEALNKGVKWISHNSSKGHFAGMFYAIHRSILDVILKNARVMTFPENCAEDETIGALCYIAASRDAYSWTDISIADNTRKFASLAIQKMDSQQWAHQLAYTAKEGHVITVGNSYVYGLPKGYQTKAARDLLYIFYNYDSLAKSKNWPDLSDKTPCSPLAIVNAHKLPPLSENISKGDPILRGQLVKVESSQVCEQNTNT